MRAEINWLDMDKGTLITLGVIGAFVVLIVALLIARAALWNVRPRLTKRTRRGY
jgi:hypothetical protein